MTFTTDVALALGAAESSWVQRLQKLEAKAFALRGRLPPAPGTKKTPRRIAGRGFRGVRPRYALRFAAASLPRSFTTSYVIF
jgi:hypothetical protein